MDKRNIINEEWATKNVSVKISVNEINERYNAFADILKEVRENYEWKDCRHSDKNYERIEKMEEWLNDLTNRAINSNDQDKPEEVIGYLLGKEKFSAGGDLPNTEDFPTEFIRDREEALTKFKERQKEDKKSSTSYSYAYIAIVYENGEVYKTFKAEEI